MKPEFNNLSMRTAGVMALFAVVFLPVELVGQETPSYLPDRLHSKFATYREKPEHRAFALGRDGAWSYKFGHDTIRNARENALSTCRTHGSGCVVIAVNNQIVIQDDPFASSTSGDEGGSYGYLLIPILIVVVSYAFFVWYKRKQGANPDMEPLRERSFRVRCSPDEVVKQAKRIAEDTTNLTHHDDEGDTVILKTYPTILSDGHFFWISPRSRSSTETKVEIHCRPRVFRFWHLFATGETRMVYDKLTNALSEHLVD